MYVSVKKSTEIPSLHRKDIVNLPSIPKVMPQMIGYTNIIHDRTVFFNVFAQKKLLKTERF